MRKIFLILSLFIFACTDSSETSNTAQKKTWGCNKLFEEVEKFAEVENNGSFDLYNASLYYTDISNVECFSRYIGDCTYSVFCVFSGENKKEYDGGHIRDWGGHYITTFPTYAEKYKYKYENNTWIKVDD